MSNSGDLGFTKCFHRAALDLLDGAARASGTPTAAADRGAAGPQPGGNRYTDLRQLAGPVGLNRAYPGRAAAAGAARRTALCDGVRPSDALITVTDLPGKGVGWQVYPALFARAGATPAARKTLTEAGGMVVDLPTLFADLAEA